MNDDDIVTIKWCMDCGHSMTLHTERGSCLLVDCLCKPIPDDGDLDINPRRKRWTR